MYKDKVVHFLKMIYQDNDYPLPTKFIKIIQQILMGGPKVFPLIGI